MSDQPLIVRSSLPERRISEGSCTARQVIPEEWARAGGCKGEDDARERDGPPPRGEGGSGDRRLVASVGLVGPPERVLKGAARRPPNMNTGCRVGSLLGPVAPNESRLSWIELEDERNRGDDEEDESTGVVAPPVGVAEDAAATRNELSRACSSWPVKAE